MQVEVLDAVRDAEEWHTIMARLPEHLRDVYFTPEYVRLHCFDPASKALLFVCRQQDNFWLYRFILRPILQIGGQAVGGKWCDIETAYGYGGPLATSREEMFLESAHRAFAGWCRSQGVVAEFIRLHPLLGNQVWLPSEVEVLVDRQTASLDLATLNRDKLPFDSTTRNKLRRAEGAGCIVETCSATAEEFACFVALYRRTMDRLQADEYYYFCDKYFAELRNLVATAGKLVFVKHEEQVLAVSIFLQGSIWSHYHLSCADPDRSLPGVVNLLIYSAAKNGVQERLKRCHLGGGRTAKPDDSLFLFKKSMATDIHAFHVGKRVHDSASYQELRSIWEKVHPELLSYYGNRILCYRYEE